MPLPARRLLQYKELFELFPVGVRNTVYSMAEPKTVRAGEYVFHNGDEGPFYMAAVMSGRLRMSVHSLEGKEMLITMVEPGEIFGEMSLLDNSHRAVDVIAEVDCTLLIIWQEDFMPVLTQHPPVMLSIMRMMCHRMRLYAHTLELIALQSLPAKFVRYLLRLSRDYGIEKDGKIIIRANLSQAEMGNQLATSRESINKQLRIFITRGYIAMDGDDIVLLDIPALKKEILPEDA